MSPLYRYLKTLRRIVLSLLIRLLAEPLRLLPVRKNRILFTAFMEKQYACSPRYISEELHRRYGSRIDILWSFRHPEKFMYLEKEQGVKVIPSSSFKYYVRAMTSRVIVTNANFKPTLPRRGGTYIINTWHGGGAYKKVSDSRKQPRLMKLYDHLRSRGVKLYLSSSRAFTQWTIRESFHYKGEVLEAGLPRNDILLHPPEKETVDAIRKKIGLKSGQKLCLYAPTWRSDWVVHYDMPDYARTLDALKRRFGGEWVMGYRSHHVTMFLDQSRASAGALDLTDYPDMQQLLLVCDCLITDYSSCIWDASLAFRPTFLYCRDLEKYTKEIDFYTDIHTWPFPLAENMEELEHNIACFDQSAYEAACRAHHESLGSCETGRATQAVCEKIAEVMGLD